MSFHEPRLAPLKKIFLHFAEPKASNLRRSNSFSGYVPFSLCGAAGQHGNLSEVAVFALLEAGQPTLHADYPDVDSTPHWPDTDDESESWDGDVQRKQVDLDGMSTSTEQTTPLRLSLTALLPSAEVQGCRSSRSESKESQALGGLPMSFWDADDQCVWLRPCGPLRQRGQQTRAPFSALRRSSDALRWPTPTSQGGSPPPKGAKR